MTTTTPIQDASDFLDLLWTQAYAISALSDLLCAVDPDSEYLQPATLNNIGHLLDVISTAMINASLGVKRSLGKIAD